MAALLSPWSAAVTAARSVGVLVELDLGARRVGVPSPAQAVALARSAAETEGVEYRGVAFYPGHIRAPLAAQDDAIAQLSRDVGVFVAALSDSGLAPAVVSGGSTPTA